MISRRCVGRSCRSLARTSVGQSPESSEQYPFRIGGWLARLGCKSEAGNKCRADRTPLSQSIPTSRQECNLSLGNAQTMQDEGATNCSKRHATSWFPLFLSRPCRSWPDSSPAFEVSSNSPHDPRRPCVLQALPLDQRVALREVGPTPARREGILPEEGETDGDHFRFLPP